MRPFFRFYRVLRDPSSFEAFFPFHSLLLMWFLCARWFFVLFSGAVRGPHFAELFLSLQVTPSAAQVACFLARRLRCGDRPLHTLPFEFLLRMIRIDQFFVPTLAPSSNISFSFRPPPFLELSSDLRWTPPGSAEHLQLWLNPLLPNPLVLEMSF